MPHMICQPSEQSGCHDSVAVLNRNRHIVLISLCLLAFQFVFTERGDTVVRGLLSKRDRGELDNRRGGDFVSNRR
jgi:hypothetical protein